MNGKKMKAKCIELDRMASTSRPQRPLFKQVVEQKGDAKRISIATGAGSWATECLMSSVASRGRFFTD
jgi:hypothetical protein